MKTNLKTVKLLATYLSIAVVLGCSKKDTTPSPQNCVKNAEKVSEAALVYINGLTKANCEAYKNTVRDFYKSCPNYLSAADKKDLDGALAQPCPN